MAATTPNPVRKDDVKIGATYKAKITDRLTIVRIDRENPHGGWDATNTMTGRKVRIRSASKLRGEADPRTVERTPIGDPIDKPELSRTAKAKLAELEATKAAEDVDPENTTAEHTAPEPTPAPTTETEPRVTFKDAAETVLRKADGPMKVKQIAEAAIPLVTPAPQGKTPAATLGAHLITDANKGGRFVKTAPGTFDVRDLNPRGAAKRPAKRNGKNGGAR